MNPRIQLAYNALWMAHPVLQSILAAVLYRRKLNRAFPVFFYYILSQIAIFALVFPVHLYASYATFFYVYATCIGISLNTAALDEAEAMNLLAETEARTGLPCVDAVRTGVARLVDCLPI